MVYELKKERTEKDIKNILEDIKTLNIVNKKNLAKHYGCLVRNIDGLEYQKAMRYR